MPMQQSIIRRGLFLCAVLAATGLALVSGGWNSTVWAQTVPGATPTPTPAPMREGVIAICVTNPPPNAWAVVQWQDRLGGWHEVTSWSARLDAEAYRVPGLGTCTVRWVLRENFSEQPFQWMIYTQRGGAVWASSYTFSLPQNSGEWVWAKLPPTPGAIAPAPTAAPVAGQCSGTHTVVAGENLFRIAYNCGLTTASLATLNGLSFPYAIYPGQILRFPNVSPVVVKGKCSGTHTVEAGENLFRLALNCGLTTKHLAAVNSLSFPYTLYVGQKLRFP
jgi:LysM repeat protein